MKKFGEFFIFGYDDGTVKYYRQFRSGLGFARVTAFHALFSSCLNTEIGTRGQRFMSRVIDKEAEGFVDTEQ